MGKSRRPGGISPPAPLTGKAEPGWGAALPPYGFPSGRGREGIIPSRPPEAFSPSLFRNQAGWAMTATMPRVAASYPMRQPVRARMSMTAARRRRTLR